jgi:ATP-dependent RNA helicase HelY
LPFSREPDAGFAAAMYSWATYGDLTGALLMSDNGTGNALPAGDFVRWCRQVLDLLDQVRLAAPSPQLRVTAKRAIGAVRRGVVAIDSM